jgi:hypothetical protein
MAMAYIVSIVFVKKIVAVGKPFYSILYKF